MKFQLDYASQQKIKKLHQEIAEIEAARACIKSKAPTVFAAMDIRIMSIWEQIWGIFEHGGDFR
jgi:hypothetical protein